MYTIKFIDNILRELVNENEPSLMIKKYLAKRENRIKELKNYCGLSGLSGLDYTQFYQIEIEQKRQSK